MSTFRSGGVGGVYSGAPLGQSSGVWWPSPLGDATNATLTVTNSPTQPQHWCVAQIFSRRAHLIRAEIEQAGHGTFQPTFARRWYVDGKVSARETPLLPGYLLFRSTSDGWGSIGSIEGVIRVLRCGDRASPVRDDEMIRLVIDHATGAHNRIETEPKRSYRRRRRKPRPSKRARMRAAQGRAAQGRALAENAPVAA